jgi:hypothetical protein
VILLARFRTGASAPATCTCLMRIGRAGPRGGSGFAALFPDQAELNELALLSLHFGGRGASIEHVAKKLERPVGELAARLEAFNIHSQCVLGIDLFELDDGLATAAV